MRKKKADREEEDEKQGETTISTITRAYDSKREEEERQRETKQGAPT